MRLYEAIILGLIQGATEFLPVSSSGHLVILPTILHISPPDLALVGILHAGTLLAVLLYFRQDIMEIVTAVWQGLQQRQPLATAQARLGWYLVLGTVPAATLGVLLEKFFQQTFEQPVVAAVFLLVTAVLLIMGERLLSGSKSIGTMSWTDAGVIGLFQMLALLPGISRSGSTIVGGLVRGLDRPAGARFSFLLSIPVILGAGLFSLLELATGGIPALDWSLYLAAFVTSAVAGYACITLLINWVRSHSLYIFAAYCALFGTLYLLYSVVR